MPCTWLLALACLLSWQCSPGAVFSPLPTLRPSRSLAYTGTLWILSGFFSIRCSICWGKHMADVVPPRLYYRVYATLLAATLLTWGVSRLHLGSPLGVTVALTIAMVKALLVVLFFMHVRYSSWLTWVFVGAGVAWMGHILILTMSDYLTRAMVPGW